MRNLLRANRPDDRALEERITHLEKELEQERLVVTELRTAVEVLQKSTNQQWTEINELKEIAQSLLKTAQVQQQNLELVAEAVHRHRQEGHQ